MEVTLGGDRLGSGNKQKIALRHFERSTHDLSYRWKSTLATGVLTPFMSETALPGDSFDIKLDCDILTSPTIGPLFGNYKVQLDVFQIPIRLYQAQLHNNKLGIGMKMAEIKLPQIRLVADATIDNQTITNDYYQIHPSSIFSYLGINGLGLPLGDFGETSPFFTRNFTGLKYLGYYDIFKNYYANKQEDKCYQIHNETNITNEVSTVELVQEGGEISSLELTQFSGGTTTTMPNPTAAGPIGAVVNNGYNKPYLVMVFNNTETAASIENYRIQLSSNDTAIPWTAAILSDVFEIIDVVETPLTKVIHLTAKAGYENQTIGNRFQFYPNDNYQYSEPKLKEINLTDFDDMRNYLLSQITNTNAVIINPDAAPEQPEAYLNPLKFSTINYQGRTIKNIAARSPLEGLMVKTYQSDLFNNWVKTDWIDGEDGISAITAVDTTDGEFTIDTLNLSMKVYYMLNRIAVTGGSYDDWLEAVYDHDTYRRCETPIYLGGLSKELTFQQIISNSASDAGGASQPLGTLAGRGVLTNKHKGGTIHVSIDEPSIIMGIISLTPRLDYGQGIKWDNNIETMDDWHKPQLDEIGFQDLLAEQLAWFGTQINLVSGSYVEIKRSAGKQPAWINYMTNVNEVHGNFAPGFNENFMVLTRNYEKEQLATTKGIADLTTYIDPVKFNNVFADTRRDAQNFWCQIDCDIKARRKMSAKVMPNL